MAENNSTFPFEKRFQHLLENAEVTPRPSAWEKIESQLDQKSKRRFPIYWIFLGLPILISLGILGFALGYSSSKQKSSSHFFTRSHSIESGKIAHYHSKSTQHKSTFKKLNSLVSSGTNNGIDKVKTTKKNSIDKAQNVELMHSTAMGTSNAKKLLEIENLMARHEELLGVTESPTFILSKTESKLLTKSTSRKSGLYATIGLSAGTNFYLNSKNYVDPVLGEGVNHTKSYTVLPFLVAGYQFKNQVHLEALVEYAISESKFASVNLENNLRGRSKKTSISVSLLAGKNWALPMRRTDFAPSIFFSAGPSYDYLQSSTVNIDYKTVALNYRMVNSYNGVDYYPRHLIGAKSRVGVNLPLSKTLELSTGVQGGVVADAKAFPSWFEKENTPFNEGMFSVFLGIRLRGNKP